MSLRKVSALSRRVFQATEGLVCPVPVDGSEPCPIDLRPSIRAGQRHGVWCCVTRVQTCWRQVVLSCAVVGSSLSKAFRPRPGSGAVETPASSRSPQRASRNLPRPLRRRNATGSRPLGTRGVMPLGESFSVLQRAPSSFPPPSGNKGAVRPVGWPALGSSLSDTEPVPS